MTNPDAWIILEVPDQALYINLYNVYNESTLIVNLQLFWVVDWRVNASYLLYEAHVI